MVSHRRDNSRFGVSFQFLANNESEIKIVALRLFPNIVWSVVSSPDYQI